jgi:hypothetical protein
MHIIFESEEEVEGFEGLPPMHIKYDIESDGTLIWVNGIPEIFIHATDKI